jgi:hypothetical protein
MKPHDALAIALLAAACGGAADAGRSDPRPDPGAGAVFNLGPLGGSGHPAGRDLAVTIAQQEHHPGAVVLRDVVPGAPLAAAGLRAGDAIVQVAGELLPNKPDPALELIAAVEARVSAGGPVTLGWLRGGELQTAAIALAEPPLERGLPGPLERFDRIAAAALARLVALQRPDGSFPARADDAAARLACTGLAGCAFLAGGSGLRDGAFADAVRACSELVGAALREPQPAPAAWGDACALLFVAELAAKSPTQNVQRMLQLGTARLLAAQADDGGWPAGDAGRDAADLATNLALLALGAAERAGATVPADVIARGCRYLQQVANDGHVGRSRREGFDRRNEAGRCAGAASALRALGCRAQDPFVRRLLDYAGQAGAELAHAPLAAPLHVLSVAIASRQEGLPAWQRFWVGFRHLLVAVQASDGSCRWPARAGARPLPFEGEAWDTACLALIAALQHDRVRLLLARHALAQPERDASGAPLPGGADRAATPPDAPAGDAQMIRITNPEDLRKQLEDLGLPQDQIDALDKQMREQVKEKKGK